MTADMPWFKFHPAAWRADQSLRVVSLAARGLWIECMCIMHEAIPYGHLVVNGRPVTDTQLAALTGTPPDQIAELLAELDAAGVYSRTSQGVIYSRRMTRDDKKARTARKVGKLGGNPTLCKQTGNRPSDNPADKMPVKRRDKPKKIEDRISPLNPPASGGTGMDGNWKGKTMTVWRLLLEGFRDKRLWPTTAGPQPGEPGCDAPRDLIAEVLGAMPEAAE